MIFYFLFFHFLSFKIFDIKKEKGKKQKKKRGHPQNKKLMQQPVYCQPTATLFMILKILKSHFSLELAS